MKKSMYIFGILALLLAGTACNNSDNGDPQGNEFPDGIQPVVLADELGTELSEELTAFFERYLPPGSSTFQYPPTNFFGDKVENKCLMINHADELQALFPSSVEIPSIDFDKYTLIIGQQLVDDNSCRVTNQSLIIGSEEMTLNLLIRLPHFPDAVPPPYKQYHWGFYPKLPQMPIEVNITYYDTFN